MIFSDTKQIRIPAIQQMVDLFRHPAIIMNHRTEVIAWNGAAAAIIVDFAMLPDRIMMGLVLKDSVIRERVINRNEFAAYVVQQFRAFACQHDADFWYTAFMQRMCRESSLFLKLWNRSDVRVKGLQPFFIDHPCLGRSSFQIMPFTRINGDNQLCCWVFLPSPKTDAILT